MKIQKTHILSLAGAVASLLLATSPAWAHDEHDRYDGRDHERYRERDHDRDHERRHGNGYRSAGRMMPIPAVQYVYAPAPVYYVQPAYTTYRQYTPAPDYYPTAYAPLPMGAIGGVVAGAAIGSRFGQGNGHIAAIAAGSVLGALIGNNLTSGR